MLLALLLGLADTYHVDPAGDDRRDGRSPDRAWRTAARAASADLKPGDRVLFKRGGAWRESLHVRTGGAPGRRIEFGAYGEGAKPRFLGSDVLPASAFRPTADVESPVNALLVDGEFYRNAAHVPAEGRNGTPEDFVKRTPGSWMQSGRTLTVHFKGPVRDVSLCVRDDAVWVQASHVVVRDLVVDETAKLHGGYGFRVSDGRDIRLEACEAYRAGKHHFGVINATEFVGAGLQGELAMPDQGPGGASTFVSYSDARRKGDTSVWENCIARRMEDAGSGRVYPAFVTHGEGIGRLDVLGLRSERGPLSVGNGESGATVRIEGGELVDADLALYGDGMLVDGLRLTGKDASVAVNGARNVLQNLVVVGCSPGFRGHQAAVVVKGKGNAVRFSTIILGDDAKDFNAAVSLVDEAPEFTFAGNVVVTRGTGLRFWKEGFQPGWVRAERNIYPPGVVFRKPGGDADLGAWQALGLDAASVAADPRLGAGLLPEPGSPALDNGPADGPGRDAAGRPRPRGKAPDCGAYERQ